MYVHVAQCNNPEWYCEVVDLKLDHPTVFSSNIFINLNYD